MSKTHSVVSMIQTTRSLQDQSHQKKSQGTKIIARSIHQNKSSMQQDHCKVNPIRTNPKPPRSLQYQSLRTNPKAPRSWQYQTHQNKSQGTKSIPQNKSQGTTIIARSIPSEHIIKAPSDECDNSNRRT